MNKIAVATGSQASLSQEIITELDIKIIPYRLNYADSSLRDTLDIKTEEFYESLVDMNCLPGTSPPSIGEVKDFVLNLSKNYDEILLFTISKKYSKMYSFCIEGKKESGLKNINIIDSGGASAYQAMMVIIASLMLKENKSIDAILKMAESFSNSCEEYLVFDTLKYLEKGGRIGKVQAFLGSMISIKPVVGHRDGASYPLFKVRSNKAALIKIIEDFKKKIPKADTPIALIYQGIYIEDWLGIVKEEMKKNFNVKYIWKSQFSAITSIHTGPKAWSICMYKLDE